MGTNNSLPPAFDQSLTLSAVGGVTGGGGGAASNPALLGAKKTCPYCMQQLSWHALSRHIRYDESLTIKKTTYLKQLSAVVIIWRGYTRSGIEISPVVFRIYFIFTWIRI